MRLPLRTLPMMPVLAAVAWSPPVLAQNHALPIVKTSEHTYVTDAPAIVDGLVVFSKFSADETNQELIAVDPSDGAEQSLVPPSKGPRLIAVDERYLVYRVTAPSATFVVIVADRTTGQRLASVRLRDPIIWGHVRGDHLTLVQAGARLSPVLVYSLPDLSLETSKEVSAVRELAPWGDKVVLVADNRLAVYDLDLNPIETAELPARYPDLNADCVPHPLRVHEDLAIVGSRCHQIAVFELAPLRLRYVLRGFANYHGFAVMDDLLFVTSNDGLDNVARVHEMASGGEIARLDIAGAVVAAAGDRLLTFERASFSTPARLRIYSAGNLLGDLLRKQADN